MKKAFIVLFACSSLFACNSPKNSNSNTGSEVSSVDVSKADSVSEISYTKAEGYFVHNTYKESGVKKITRKSEFDSIFSAAAVMGKLPTEIDFSTHYIIAIIAEESNKSPEIIIDSFKIKGTENLLEYSIKEAGETSHVSRPIALLIVDSKFDKNFKANKL